MKDILYAPWRDEYINDTKPTGCVFCHVSQNEKDDKDLHVLYRDEHCFIVMNKYPYTPGHFMVIPHGHLDALEELDTKVWQHITLKAQQGVRMLKEHFGAHGANLGMNLGSAGGAGIAEHLHLHIVPRWNKDTNFMTAVSQTRIYSTDFEKVYQNLLDISSQYFVND